MTQYKNLIAGEWVAGTTEVKNINPSDTDDVIGTASYASVKQVADAIAAARAALPKWNVGTTQLRSDALSAISNELFSRREELGELLAREEGKTRAEAIGEVGRAANIFRFFSGEVLRMRGETLASVRPGIDVTITRDPVGVIGVITPWNFPIAIPAWKIAPALAFGNAVVFKPSELTPGSAWALADIISRSGVPAGVFNLVHGTGALVGDAILSGVDAITFTGSIKTGRQIVQRATERMIHVQAEMGGKNPLIVLDDADFDIAVNCAVDGSFFQTGQRCTASSRLIVTEGIHDRFVHAVAERLGKIMTDHALKAGTQVGPVVDQRQLDQDLRYIDIGVSEGAKVLVKGELLKRPTPGHFLSPTLFTESTNQMQINREEIFGPVAAVIRAKNYEEALHIANDTPFGLSAGICTTSQKHARHFQQHSEAGLTMLNLATAGLDYHVPFGGRKASSYGPREQGTYALEFYTIVKTSYLSV
ncbi:aldehyde dehydrogenase family protein [Herbaspirillum sp. RTI4]|uniref:aldehyde dehydrogenase family protein n=1 Tax=Herbaspirillum sp. RTI4 TaxID=3048640 RepID=UPI002AB45213|nr:aldehyde dehydrogenase family protein [Herbaspirillum sp. RTI4]MDY7579930.1 aldehyde dehydrogenase family protein [Herbaspirillum sp. RTI4]MEA9983323.1 aldehyde dehydrogenase family protein [Herbaspirillum sp. RTI4]